jgi:adenylate kinase
MRNHSSLGRRITHYVSAGALVPTEIVRAEIATVLRRRKRAIVRRGAILDGYPRTLQQAKDLVRLLRDAGLGNPLLVVNLRGPDRVFVARLLGRGRSDDTPAVVRRRLRVFHKATAPILRYLRGRLPVIDVAADAAVPTIATE